MMRDAEKTIGNLIDKQRVSFIASISEDGFPYMKAMLRHANGWVFVSSTSPRILPPCGLPSIGRTQTPVFISVISVFSEALCWLDIWRY